MAWFFRKIQKVCIAWNVTLESKGKYFLEKADCCALYTMTCDNAHQNLSSAWNSVLSLFSYAVKLCLENNKQENIEENNHQLYLILLLDELRLA